MFFRRKPRSICRPDIYEVFDIVALLGELSLETLSRYGSFVISTRVWLVCLVCGWVDGLFGVVVEVNCGSGLCLGHPGGVG